MLGTERLEAYYSSNYKNHAWQKSYSQSEKHATFKQGQIEGKLTVNSKETIVELITGQVVPDFVKQLEEAGQENLITRYLQEQHHREEKSIAGPSAAFSALIGIAITALTAGTQAGSSMSVMLGLGKGAAAVGACSAAIGCIGSRLADGLLRNNGDLGKALKGLTDKKFVKNFIVKVASAALTPTLCDHLGIRPPTAEEIDPTSNKALQSSPNMAGNLANAAQVAKPLTNLQIFAGHMDCNLVRAFVNTGLRAAINHEKFLKTFGYELKRGAIDAAAATAASRIGLARYHGRINAFEQALLHGGVGAVSGFMEAGKIKDALAGGMGAFVAESVANLMKQAPAQVAKRALEKAQEQGIEPTQENLANFIQDDLRARMSVAKFSASLAAFIAGQDPDIAYQAADNAIENNAMVTGMLEGQEALALAQCIKDYSDALAKDVAAAISEATEFLKEVSADALEACADYLKANPDNPEIAADMLIGMGIANGDNDNSGILKKGVGKNQAKRQMLITAFKASPKLANSIVQKLGGAIRKASIPQGSKLEYLGPGKVRFDGVDFKAVRDLGHLSEGELNAMLKRGTCPTDLKGKRLEGHHHQQQYHREEGAFIVEIPKPNHSIANTNQHPLGNKGGLSKEERNDWDKLRKAFNKERARTELMRRNQINEQK